MSWLNLQTGDGLLSIKSLRLAKVEWMALFGTQPLCYLSPLRLPLRGRRCCSRARGRACVQELHPDWVGLGLTDAAVDGVLDRKPVMGAGAFVDLEHEWMDAGIVAADGPSTEAAASAGWCGADPALHALGGPVHAVPPCYRHALELVFQGHVIAQELVEVLPAQSPNGSGHEPDHRSRTRAVSK
jgi:hypothetical protein